MEKEEQLVQLERELEQTKNNYFEVDVEIKKLDKELRDVKLSYLKCHKKNQEIDEEQKENFINNCYEQKTIRGGGFLFKKPI